MRVGVIGPMGPDYFAENVSDALERGGHVVTHLGTASPRIIGVGLLTTSRMLAWQALPALDERGQRQIVRAAVDCRLRRSSSTSTAASCPARCGQLKRAGMRVAFWFPDQRGKHGAAAHAARAIRCALL